MYLLNKLTIKNLKLNKKRTIVTVIGIILSVSLITAVASMYSSAISSAINFEIVQKGDFHIALYDVPVKEIETLNNNREIESIHITKNVGYAKLENSKNEYKPYACIKAFTSDSLEKLAVKLVEGRFPVKDDEILISTHLNTNGRIKLKVGDTISLNVGKRVDSNGNELNQLDKIYHENSDIDLNKSNETTKVLNDEKIIDTKVVTYKIVGIMERPANNIEPYSAPGYTFITYMDDNNLSNKVDVYAKYTKSGTRNNLKVTSNILGIDEGIYTKFINGNGNLTDQEIEMISKEMHDVKYEYDINNYLISLETDPINGSGVGGLGIVVVIVCIIIVFTSVFCIKNSFDISITEKIKQYGMLRSIGATKKQIKKNVLYEATVLGIIGIPLGILAGFFASYILIIVSNYFLEDSFTTGLRLQFSFSWIAVIVAILLGIITIYLSAIRSARRASKISPIDSIRNSGNIKINSKKIKTSKIISKLFGIGGEISFKNLKRNKKKYRTTVISISVSVFVFIALFSFMQLAFANIEKEIGMTDYNITLNVDDKKVFERAIETTTLDGIKDFTIYRNMGFNVQNIKYSDEYIKILQIDKFYGTMTLEALGDVQYKKYVKSLGLDYEKIKDKAILVDKVNISKYSEEDNNIKEYTVKEYNYNKGDVIEGQINDKENTKLEIGYITDKRPFGLVNNRYTPNIIVSEEFFNNYKTPDRLIIYYDAEDAAKLQDNIEIMLKDTNYNINNIEENVKIMEKLYILVGIFLYGFIAVITLIGVTNIFNTITTNMNLRKQEFAMLKSVGMTNNEFNRMIRLESIFMGIKSLAFGISIGIGLSYLMCYYLEEEYIFPIGAIIISIIAVFLIITCIMKYSISKINKQNTIETIRNENI